VTRRLVVVESLTLDGVMQAPGGPNEDTRGGFEYGGWAAPYSDDIMGREMGKGMGQSDLLFGRWTYESMYSFWPKQTDSNPFTEVLNQTQKYVASNTLAEPLPWMNSILVSGDGAETVAALKEEPGKDIAVLGSGELVQTIMERGLVDEYTLLIHPLVLGSGRRLFRQGTKYAPLELKHSVTTTTGVMIATYTPSAAEPSA
jgi:dihydrofolate reductase